MTYFYVLTVTKNGGGTYTEVNTIDAKPTDNRASLFARALTNICARYGIPMSDAGVLFFYLEPLEL